MADIEILSVFIVYACMFVTVSRDTVFLLLRMSFVQAYMISKTDSTFSGMGYLKPVSDKIQYSRPTKMHTGVLYTLEI